MSGLHEHTCDIVVKINGKVVCTATSIETILPRIPRKVSRAWWRMRLEDLWPHRGPCGICGGPDARHRMFDAIVSAHLSGQSIDSLVDPDSDGWSWPHYTREHMVAVIRSGAGELARDFFRRQRIQRERRARKRRRGWA